MHGDFSKWLPIYRRNINGVLFQQGRVSLDSDFTAQARLTTDWQDQAGRDLIGPNIATVPAEVPDSLKVIDVTVPPPSYEEAWISVKPGRIWVNGMLVYLDEEDPVLRKATLLTHPDWNIAPVLNREAVVLEVWREAINAFQLPETMMEPALGGPDTSEHIQTAVAFRLVKLNDDEDCHNIFDRISDDFTKKPILLATLQPSKEIDGECPVTQSGGYVGFEHNLYRLEIASINDSVITAKGPMFKWSQYNGGLVGRGEFDKLQNKVILTANTQAIITSGLNDFYLETVEYDTELGHWRVTFGAKATISSNNELTLGEIYYGSLEDVGSNSVFFRLWNGILPVSAFPKVSGIDEPQELRDGICLQFKADNNLYYKSGDYWTFSLRAGGIDNPATLIDSAPPEGIHYHRVPLAILTWDANGQQLTEDIEDCRNIFYPRTHVQSCCTLTVGDGVKSQGQFNSIQAAVDYLPDTGGQICVLPGQYKEKIVIEGKNNILIRGCGDPTKIGPVPEPEVGIKIANSRNIQIESLSLDTAIDGSGIYIDSPAHDPDIEGPGSFVGLYPPITHHITLDNVTIQAEKRPAVEVQYAGYVTIRNCRISMRNQPTDQPGIYIWADEALIEGNLIVAEPDLTLPGGTFVYRNRGGLVLGEGCDGIRIVNNIIEGGYGIGITMGNTPMPSAGNYLREITIEHNRITRMYMSGIGMAKLSDPYVSNDCILIDNLKIIDNEIRYCLAGNLPDSNNIVAYGAIALADVDSLLVTGNIIEDNGTNPDYANAVCGLYIIHGEEIEIYNNRIANNGVKGGVTKTGQRGGIVIKNATAPLIPSTYDSLQILNQKGPPAVKVHDNIVSAPVGRALSAIALGPVSVSGNQFTTRSIEKRAGNVFGQANTNDLIKDVGSFTTSSAFAATVSIFNLGISHELFFKFFNFAQQGSINLDILSNTDKYKIEYDDSSRILSIPFHPPEICRFRRFLPYGKVLFTNNLCNLELLEAASPGQSLVSSIAITTLDDVGFHDNQCDVNTIDDFLLSQAYILGTTLRVTDNRFEEEIFNVLYSAVSTGLILNRTDDNISTHCIRIIDGCISSNLVPHTTVLWQHIYNRIENAQKSVCDTIT
jgi:hypothetical protein